MFKKDGDTIFAPLTLGGRCSLFVIRISGSKVLECLGKLGVKVKLEKRKVHLVGIYDDTEVLDKILLFYFKAPHSFTGEDVCELNLHCSKYIINKVYEILLSVPSVRIAENGEFSKRAFLNGKIDLVEAEGIVDLVNSSTKIQHRQAIEQLVGKNSNFFNDLRNELLEIQSSFEVMIDFPEDEVDENLINRISMKVESFKNKIKSILQDSFISSKVKNGLNIAIVGEPNTGKSSLLNFFAKKDIAIVSAIAGTTRDVLEVEVEIAGFKINLFDTAGIRESSDEIELEGIRRAIDTVKNSDLKILILDINNLKIEENIESLIDEKTLILVNKIDIVSDEYLEKVKNTLKYKNEIIFISVKNETNLEMVVDFMKNFIEKNLTPFLNSNITSERYRNALNEVVNHLNEIDFLNTAIEINAEKIRLSSFSLGQITGQINTEEVLNNIFSKFCIGK